MRTALAAGILACLVTGADARQVCVPFAQTESVMMDTRFINVCFQHDQVAKIRPIYTGKSGNMVEVILWDGTWFYKNGMTVAEMRSCVRGGACDRYQNVKLRDLTTGDVSIFKKKKRLHPKRHSYHDRSLNADTVTSSFP